MNKALSMSDPRFPDDFSLDDDLDFPASDTFVTETPHDAYDPLNPPAQPLRSPTQQLQPPPQQPRALDPLEQHFDQPAYTPQPPLTQAPPPPVQPAAPQQPYVQPAPAPTDTYVYAQPAPVAPASAPTVEVMPGRPQGQEVSTAIQFTQPPHQAFNPVGDLIATAEAAMGEVNVPRIAIHIFAERTDTADAAQQASRDRRMSRATTTVRLGGVQTALQVYQTEPTPALIIVESGAPAAQMIHELDYLAECCDADTKVVVIGAQNDIMLYRELMRRGVSEYLVAPLQPLQLIAAIGQLFNDPSAPFVGRTIAFIGARGGVGSSTVAHNTAYALSERMASETVIVDFDLPFGTAGLDFNQDPLTGVADASSPTDSIRCCSTACWCAAPTSSACSPRRRRWTATGTSRPR
jgi:pilus assembly protein CpaE